MIMAQVALRDEQEWRFPMSSDSFRVDDHFKDRSPAIRAVYDRILKAARKLGPFVEEPKKTSIHLVRKTAFAGVAARKTALVLTLKSDRDIRSPRISKHEKTSANRWHLEVKLSGPAEVNPEFVSWLEKAYVLGG